MAGKKPHNTPTPPDSQPTILGGRFDPRRMIRDQSFAGSGGTYDGLLKVTLGKPNPALFFRSHPTFHFGPIDILHVKTALGKVAKRGDMFFVEDKDALAELGRFIKGCTLHMCITVQRGVYLWPIPCPDEDGNWFEAYRQATEIIRIAEKDWIQVSWEDERGYVPHYPTEPITCEPNWYTGISDEKMMELAFERSTIANRDHPVAKWLVGRGISNG